MSQNYNVKLNLKALKNAFVTDIKGQSATKKCVCIPIENNDIFLSDKGAAYLNLTCWGANNLADGKTHLVKRSLSKKERENMTEEQKYANPIIGDMKPLGSYQNTPASSSYQDEAVTTSSNNFDDLPY